MEFEKIKELIKLVDSSSLAFFELECSNDHIKMDKSLNRGLADNNLNNVSKVNNVDNINTVLNSVSSIEKTETHVVKNEDLKDTEKEVVIEDKNWRCSFYRESNLHNWSYETYEWNRKWI